MELNFMFFVTNVMLGVGLAMDAFSVSLANGLSEPQMKRRKIAGIAGTFAFFQGLMPMLGWICVHNLITYFKSFEGWIPYIALALLCFIGGKMLFDAIKYGDDDEEKQKLTLPLLLIQAVATSIDALSVGFTIAEYSFLTALVAVCLIMAVTFVICLAGVIIGRKFGTKFAGKAEIAGGIILILIGIEIFISGVFF